MTYNGKVIGTFVPKTLVSNRNLNKVHSDDSFCINPDKAEIWSFLREKLISFHLCRDNLNSRNFEKVF